MPRLTWKSTISLAGTLALVMTLDAPLAQAGGASGRARVSTKQRVATIAEELISFRRRARVDQPRALRRVELSKKIAPETILEGLYGRGELVVKKKGRALEARWKPAWGKELRLGSLYQSKGGELRFVPSLRALRVRNEKLGEALYAGLDARARQPMGAPPYGNGISRDYRTKGRNPGHEVRPYHGLGYWNYSNTRRTGEALLWAAGHESSGALHEIAKSMKLVHEDGADRSLSIAWTTANADPQTQDLGGKVRKRLVFYGKEQAPGRGGGASTAERVMSMVFGSVDRRGGGARFESEIFAPAEGAKARGQRHAATRRETRAWRRWVIKQRARQKARKVPAREKQIADALFGADDARELPPNVLLGELFGRGWLHFTKRGKLGLDVGWLPASDANGKPRPLGTLRKGKLTLEAKGAECLARAVGEPLISGLMADTEKTKQKWGREDSSRYQLPDGRWMRAGQEVRFTAAERQSLAKVVAKRLPPGTAGVLASGRELSWRSQTTYADRKKPTQLPSHLVAEHTLRREEVSGHQELVYRYRVRYRNARYELPQKRKLAATQARVIGSLMQMGYYVPYTEGPKRLTNAEEIRSFVMYFAHHDPKTLLWLRPDKLPEGVSVRPGTEQIWRDAVAEFGLTSTRAAAKKLNPRDAATVRYWKSITPENNWRTNAMWEVGGNRRSGDRPSPEKMRDFVRIFEALHGEAAIPLLRRVVDNVDAGVGTRWSQWHQVLEEMASGPRR